MIPAALLRRNSSPSWASVYSGQRESTWIIIEDVSRDVVSVECMNQRRKPALGY